MKSGNLRELQEVFEVEHGNKLDLNKMETCQPSADAIAFIGRSGGNNGVVAFVKPLTGVSIFSAGLITVALGGAALSSFVQSRRFYTAQNIDVLRPRTAMTLEEKLFYCLCIEANRFRYSTFGREANRTLKNLLVPKYEAVPNWVTGAAKFAVSELSKDLATAIEE